MTRPLKVFFPRFQTESHRTAAESARVVVELARVGVHCDLEVTPDTDAALVMSVFATEDAAAGYHKEPHHRYVPGYKRSRRIKVVHYCWDLYPWVVEDGRHPDRARWVHYLTELRTATEVWVPTPPVARRVEQYTGRGAVVVPPVYCPWEPDATPSVTDSGLVVDVMRHYPGDPNADAVGRACDELGLPWVKTGASLPWPEYKKAVCSARLLVSAYREASTGSLALLDGYKLGKTVLVSDSEWNGARDLFGTRAHKFRFEDAAHLREEIQELYHRPDRYEFGYNEPERAAWVRDTYGEAAFARRVADNLGRLCG